jgi:O-antigen/teichoic acid export membrane protein
MRRARAHASPIVTARVVTGAEGYHEPVTGEAARGAHEANDATRGSAIKLAAEVASRLLGFATTFLLIRGLRAAVFGSFTALSTLALLLAESGELGLQALASRALVARTLSLRSLIVARLALAPLVTAVALAASTAVPALAGRWGAGALDGPALALLVAWFALSGWGEFLGVALRCRRAKRQEALLLVVLRGTALAAAAVALFAGASLRGVSLALALSPLPAIVLGAVLVRRASAEGPAREARPASVLRESFPLALHGGLLLLSPRVELLVLWLLQWLREEGDPALGFFSVALSVIWFLSVVPTAIVAGAMPALTREALRGEGSVRRRTAATLALVAAPAAVGLALVARPLAGVLLGAGYGKSDYGAVAACLRIMALALPALFLNALVFGALIAAGRASWLPRLTAARVALAFALAFVLVPAFGERGASAGLVCAEWALLAAGTAACRRALFAIPVAAPLAWALAACVPMALAVNGVRESLPLAVPIGALSWAATLAAVARLRPGLARELVGGLR